MKKTIRTILCMAAFAVLAVSCQKEINEVEHNTKDTIEISINGLMGEYTQVDATKSSLVNTVRVSWENGDIVYVYDGTQCLGSLVASIDGTEDRYAILSTDKNHTVTAPAAGTKLTLVHSPLLTEAPAVSEGALSISLANQSDTKAPFVAYATLDYNNEASITNAIVPFKFATSVIKVNCTGLNANKAILYATLSNVNTICKLPLSGTAAPTGYSNGTITRTGDAYFAATKVNSEGEAVFQIAVPNLEIASAPRVLTILQNLTYFSDENFTTKSLSVATSSNTVCQLVDNTPNGALPGEFSVSETKKVLFSKGNLWADSDNVLHFEDAQWKSSPDSDGTMEYASHVSHFTWSSTLSAAVGGNDSGDYLFCDENNKMSIDGSEALYYALSNEELLYLFNTRTMKNGKDRFTEQITYDGKIGLVLYADDYSEDPISGNVDKLPEGVAFLPAAGYRGDTNNFHLINRAGMYWSSTSGEIPAMHDAYMFSFTPSAFSRGFTAARNLGHAIRLVTDVTE